VNTPGALVAVISLLIMNQPMDRKILIVCGLIGAVITFFVTLLCNISLFSSHFQSYIGYSPSGKISVSAVIITSLIIGILGFIAGRMGAKSRNVKNAFRTGGVCFFLAAVICISLAHLNIVFSSQYGLNWHIHFLYSTIFWIAISTCTGSLVCGITAIIARDYNQFKKLRLVPQFTIAEIFIVTTQIAIILGAIMSIRNICA
jgi:hypothetical protein